MFGQVIYLLIIALLSGLFTGSMFSIFFSYLKTAEMQNLDIFMKYL